MKTVAYKPDVRRPRKAVAHHPSLKDTPKLNPCQDFYDQNREAVERIPTHSARVLARLAVAAAEAANPWGTKLSDGRAYAMPFVNCCRGWARRNHQSFNKYFGEALRNIA